MTFWNTVAAVIVAWAARDLIHFAVDMGLGYARRKKIDRILEDLDEFWAEEAAKKPVRKKAAAKKK